MRPDLRSFRRFWVVGRGRFVHCVPVRTSPVAVHVGSSIRAWDEVSAVGQGTTKVGVVGSVCLDLEELIVGPHSRCDGLLLLAL